jgi:UDP-2-acetamido-2-deoxy-ribo-hexuluronate aminotransferase
MRFRDLNEQYNHLKAEIDQSIAEVIESSAFILGSKVRELEETLAAYVGTKHCVSCANGTDALQLVLMAWGVGPGDAVFTSDFTFIASAGTASILGATPVMVDIDSRTFNIDPAALETQIKRVIAEGKLKPRVIVPVDLFGLPAEYPQIEKIACKYGLKILEDGAQGFGGSIDGRRACSFGDAATTSFFPAKPLGCYGDGGAIFTDDDDLDAMLRSLRTQGGSPEDKYDNQITGMNSRLDTLQAAILLAKFRAFEARELDAVNWIAMAYSHCLKNLVVTPFVPSGYVSSWAQYSVMAQDGAQRARLQAALKEAGVPTMIYYTRGLHQQTVYQNLKLPDAWYPNTIKATRTVLNLPMHPYLPESDIALICETIRRSINP